MAFVASPSQASAQQAGQALQFDEPDHYGQSRYRILESLGRGSFGEV